MTVIRVSWRDNFKGPVRTGVLLGFAHQMAVVVPDDGDKLIELSPLELHAIRKTTEPTKVVDRVTGRVVDSRGSRMSDMIKACPSVGGSDHDDLG